MQRNDFCVQFDRLCEAFTVTNKESKIKIYFEELGTSDLDVFREAIRRIIRDNDRFPPISVILQTMETIKPQSHEAVIREPCALCDGYGWVIFHNRAFRGRCRHGNKLSESIPYAPMGPVEQKKYRDKFDADDAILYGKEGHA